MQGKSAISWGPVMVKPISHMPRPCWVGQDKLTCLRETLTFQDKNVACPGKTLTLCSINFYPIEKSGQVLRMPCAG